MTSRTAGPPSTGTLNNPGPSTSRPPVTTQAPSGDQLIPPCYFDLFSDRLQISAVSGQQVKARATFPSCRKGDAAPIEGNRGGTEKRAVCTFPDFDGL